MEEEVRRLALDYGGYLSEVHNGDFLLAFEEAKDALLFAVDAQEACETMPWQSRAGEISPRTPSPHIPYASPRVPYPRRDRPLSPQGEAERRTERVGGPGDGAGSPGTASHAPLRLKCGLSEGVVSNAYPHPVSGRVAYFGKVLNRAARIANLARAGQTLVDGGTMRSAFAEGELEECGLEAEDLGHMKLKGVRDRDAQHMVSPTSTRTHARTHTGFPCLSSAVKASPADSCAIFS